MIDEVGGGVKSPSAFDFKGVKLYIGIPTRGTGTMHFATSLAVTSAVLSKIGADVQIHQSQMSCFVDMSRNTLVAEFLKTDCTHMLQIDDDMGWNADAVLHMLAHDREFIAAAGPKKTDAGDEFCCTIHINADETPIVEKGLISASKVGAAFVLFKRAAIERMIKAYPEMFCGAIEKEFGYRFYEPTYSGNKFQSEDYNFCDRYTAAGGEIWIYPNVDFIHTGAKDYTGNYHKFLMGAPKEAPKAEPEGLAHSIVIVAYKGEAALNRCLRSLAEHAPRNSEIIIVDNSPKQVKCGSETADSLHAKYQNVIVHYDGINKGFAEGCNVGARLAKGRNLVFVNPDTVVYAGWAESLASHLRQGVGAVGPLSNFVCGMQNWVCYAHSAAVAKEDATPEYCRLAANGIAAARFHSGLETKLLIGFFLMVPRKVWDAVGEFDPAFVLGCDDLDYSMRVRDAGYKLVIAPDVFVYHEGHVSFREEGHPAMEMNRLSESHMRKKLHATYPKGVPTSTELWGCEIFPTDFETELSSAIASVQR